MIRRVSTSLLLIAVFVSVANTVSLAQSRTPLTHHVREVILNGQARLVGRLPGEQAMHFDIVLAMRDQAGLQNFLREVYDPSSPNYRHFLSVQEFTNRFGPSQEDYDALLHFAEVNGFEVAGGSRDAMDVQFKGSVGTIEQAFHVTMGVYQHPTENRNFYAPDREPTLDLPFKVWHISGLDNYATPHSALVRKNAGGQSNATIGSGPGNSFLGSDMRAAYYTSGGGTLTGTGQTLGLLEYAGTDLADLTTYYTNVGQTNTVPITLWSTDGTPTSCLANAGCDDTEQTIDMTQALGMAPGMSSLIMYVGSSDSALLSCMSSTGGSCPAVLPPNLSSSWYWPPPDPGTDDPFFTKMAAQGQSFFEATGDSGRWEAKNTWWPMESPYVIGVGGTDLETSSAGGPWSSETAWSDGGGGVSPDGFGIPSWQTIAANGCPLCSTTLRNGPDVSANANFTFYVCADQTTCSENAYGGTSFAAPMWAAYVALVNEQAALNLQPTVGFINPSVYTIGLGSSYTSIFHDITAGSNGWPATYGYDLATGWGSPNGPALINALLEGTGAGFSTTASPRSQSVVGGQSTSYTATVTAAGGFSGTVTLGVSGLPSGASGNFTPPTISGSGSSTLNVNTGTATPGSYTVEITGTDGSLNSSTLVTLVITSLPGKLTFTPTSLVFGHQVLNTTSAAKKISVKSTGTATVNFTSVAASGDFAISSNTCTGSLPVGQTCITMVTFTPTATGTRTGSVTYTDDATGSPQSVSLSGTGVVAATLAPVSGTFKQAELTTSAAKAFTLTNNQSITLNVSSVAVSADYAETDNCTPTVAPLGHCTINVTFTPPGVGTFNGTLTVTDDAANSPQSSTLSGTGLAQATINKTSLIFGMQTVGTTSAPKQATIKNNLPTALTFSTVTTGDFAESDTCSGSVPANGGTCILNVTFTPTAKGTRTGTLTVNNSSIDTPFTVSLTGTGK